MVSWVAIWWYLFAKFCAILMFLQAWAGAVAAQAPATPAAPADPYGCTAALAYLTTHAYPGVTFECGAPTPDPGALGYTQISYIPGTPNVFTWGAIWIADPCPNVYENEASNSWVLMGQSSAPIDAYGEGCHS